MKWFNIFQFFFPAWQNSSKMGKSNTEKSKEFRKCQLAYRTFGVTENQEEEQNQIQTILKKQKETEEKGNFLNFPP